MSAPTAKAAARAITKPNAITLEPPRRLPVADQRKTLQHNPSQSTGHYARGPNPTTSRPSNMWAHRLGIRALGTYGPNSADGRPVGNPQGDPQRGYGGSPGFQNRAPLGLGTPGPGRSLSPIHSRKRG